MLAQVDQTPSTDPIALGLRSVQDVGLERRLLTRSESLRATGTRTVVQTVRALSIEALDRIVQGLRSMPASRAASVRVMPSRALAIASNRRLARVSLSRAALWRRSDGE
jgi:hypothetical protein